MGALSLKFALEYFGFDGPSSFEAIGALLEPRRAARREAAFAGVTA